MTFSLWNHNFDPSVSFPDRTCPLLEMKIVLSLITASSYVLRVHHYYACLGVVPLLSNLSEPRLQTYSVTRKHFFRHYFISSSRMEVHKERSKVIGAGIIEDIVFLCPLSCCYYPLQGRVMLKNSALFANFQSIRDTVKLCLDSFRFNNPALPGWLSSAIWPSRCYSAMFLLYSWYIQLQ